LPADRLPALLASAANAFLVRRDRPVPLAGYFPEPGAPQPRFDDRFFPAFRAFCSARLDDIAMACQARRYQMNEVARCTQIVLGIAAASTRSDGQVALVDLGTGAGLGLQADLYQYRVGTATYGPDEAGLTLACAWVSLDPLVPLGPAGRDSVQGLGLPSALIRDYQQGGVFAVLGVRTFDGASDRGRLLGRAHPSGEWIEWLSS
jgi:hypothetical protein